MKADEASMIENRDLILAGMFSEQGQLVDLTSQARGK